MIVAPFFVLIRPDLTGWMISWVVVLVMETQSDRTLELHVPAEVRLSTLFDVIKSEFWRVGLMMSFPSWTKTFSSSNVVSSNWPLLKRYILA